jgi:hypothetical protein
VIICSMSLFILAIIHEPHILIMCQKPGLCTLCRLSYADQDIPDEEG